MERCETPHRTLPAAEPRLTAVQSGLCGHISADFRHSGAHLHGFRVNAIPISNSPSNSPNNASTSGASSWRTLHPNFHQPYHPNRITRLPTLEAHSDQHLQRLAIPDRNRESASFRTAFATPPKSEPRLQMLVGKLPCARQSRTRAHPTGISRLRYSSSDMARDRRQPISGTISIVSSYQDTSKCLDLRKFDDSAGTHVHLLRANIHSQQRGKVVRRQAKDREKVPCNRGSWQI